eukprot:Nk52_evm54s164 gene=Nk52_evmTU54s164
MEGLAGMAGNTKSSAEADETAKNNYDSGFLNLLQEADGESELREAISSIVLKHCMSVHKELGLSEGIPGGKLKGRESILTNTILQALWGSPGKNEAAMKEHIPSMSTMSQVCGHVFSKGEPTYQCIDCGMDATCVLCSECFQNGPHKSHNYRLSSSHGGGCCDCGDVEAWIKDASCSIHGRGMENDESVDPLETLPRYVVERAQALFRAILWFVVSTYCEGYVLPGECEKDEYFCILMNDEKHTFDEVIHQLVNAVGCSSEKAVLYANVVDSRGRAFVRKGTESECRESAAWLERINLLTNVCTSLVVAQQSCAFAFLLLLKEVSNSSDGLRRIVCMELTNSKVWESKFFTEASSEESAKSATALDRLLLTELVQWKEVRSSLRELYMSSLLKDPSYKKVFGYHFAINYKEIQESFQRDDHSPADSIISFSVQIFTTPSVVEFLVQKHNLTGIVVGCLMGFFSQAEENGLLICDHPIVSTRKYYNVLLDFKYILRHTEVMKQDPSVIDLGLSLIKLLQGMDPSVRQKDEHVEYDSDTWLNAFSLYLYMIPNIFLLQKCCVTSKEHFLSAVTKAITLLLEGDDVKKLEIEKIASVDGGSISAIKYDVLEKACSLHIPVNRFIANLLLHSSEFNLDIGNVFVSISTSLNMSLKDLSLLLVEHPLRIFLLVAQVRAGLWARNGFSIKNQVYNYLGVNFRELTFDNDLRLMQIAALSSDINDFAAMVLYRFGLDSFLNAHESMDKVVECMSDEKLDLCVLLSEDYFQILISLFCERYAEGVGEVSKKEIMERDLIHKLCIQSYPYSELSQTISVRFVDNPEFDRLLQEITIFKYPEGMEHGVYELKEELYSRYEPFFFHYSRRERDKAEEKKRERIKKTSNPSDILRPRMPPSFTPLFKGLQRLIFCDTLVRNIFSVLWHAISSNQKRFSDHLMYQVLYLIGLGVQDQKTISVPNEGWLNVKYEFVVACTKQRCQGECILSLLVKLEKHDSGKEHTMMIKWLVEQFSESDVEEAKSIVNGLRKGSESALDPAEERRRRAKAARERQAKIMAKFSAMQKKFAEDNAEFLNEDSEAKDQEEDFKVEDPSSVYGRESFSEQGANAESGDEKMTCILCQEEEQVDDWKNGVKSMVVVSFVQKSAVFKVARKRRDVTIRGRVQSLVERKLCEPRMVGVELENKDSDCETGVFYNTFPELFHNSSLGELTDEDYMLKFLVDDRDNGVHISSCGHAMHFDCWDRYFKTLIRKHQRQPLRAHNENLEKGEYLCPLCKTIGNTVMPVTSVNKGSLSESEKALMDITKVQRRKSIDKCMKNKSKKKRESSEGKRPITAGNEYDFQAFTHFLSSLRVAFVLFSSNEMSHDEGSKSASDSGDMAPDSKDTSHEMSSTSAEGEPSPSTSRGHRKSFTEYLTDHLKFLVPSRRGSSTGSDGEEENEKNSGRSRSRLSILFDILNGKKDRKAITEDERANTVSNFMVRIERIYRDSLFPDHFSKKIAPVAWNSCSFSIACATESAVLAFITSKAQGSSSQNLQVDSNQFIGVSFLECVPSRTKDCLKNLVKVLNFHAMRFREDLYPHTKALLKVIVGSHDLGNGKQLPSLLSADIFSIMLKSIVLLGSNGILNCLYSNDEDCEEGSDCVYQLSYNAFSNLMTLMCVAELVKSIKCSLLPILHVLNEDKSRNTSGSSSPSLAADPEQSAFRKLTLRIIKALSWIDASERMNLCECLQKLKPEELTMTLKADMIYFLRKCCLLRDILFPNAKEAVKNDMKPIPEDEEVGFETSSLVTRELNALVAYVGIPRIADLFAGFKSGETGCEVSDSLSHLLLSFTEDWCLGQVPENGFEDYIIPEWLSEASSPQKGGTKKLRMGAKTISLSGIDPGRSLYSYFGLIPLPEDFTELFNHSLSVKCGNCNSTPTSPALCLSCNMYVCAQSMCCKKDDKGECYQHAQKCGYGTAMFLLLKRCTIFMLAGDRGTFYPAPYLDSHGEPDIGLRRGRPLHLNAYRYSKLNRLWCNHGVASEITRSFENSPNATDWTQF